MNILPAVNYPHFYNYHMTYDWQIICLVKGLKEMCYLISLLHLFLMCKICLLQKKKKEKYELRIEKSHF